MTAWYVDVPLHFRASVSSLSQGTSAFFNAISSLRDGRVPNDEMRDVAAMPGVVQAQENRKEALAKAKMMAKTLALMKLKKDSESVRARMQETLSYYELPTEWYLV